ncbi:hypothetical protein [Mannheimia varigena]|uniref:hypothetical protein n=1 Tax=Mannheimia varigena TaxID=85404 RepID=UPI0015B444E4|nr:hypothetical protein [Mannheimia varigena]QLD32988.1 hypothetical protein A6B42_04060 [Mannheimia varigena]
MTKPKLPPMKWYTLEQAARKISKLTNEYIDVAELLHYAFINKLELCVYAKYKENDYFIIDGEVRRDLIVDNAQQEIKNIGLVFYQDTIMEILNRNKDVIPIYQEDYFAEVEDEFSYLQIAQNFDDESLIDVTRYDGLIAIYLESLKLIPNDFQLGKTIKVTTAFKIPTFQQIHTQLQLPRATNNCQIISFNVDCNAEEFRVISEIKVDSLLISPKEIDLFLNNGEIIKKAETKASNGRPTKNIKSLILEIAKETFKSNPQQSRNKIGTAIFDYLEKAGYFLEYERVDFRTIDNYLKECGIGKPKAQNRDKVTIKDPFKSQ